MYVRTISAEDVQRFKDAEAAKYPPNRLWQLYQALLSPWFFFGTFAAILLIGFIQHHSLGASIVAGVVMPAACIQVLAAFTKGPASWQKIEPDQLISLTPAPEERLKDSGAVTGLLVETLRRDDHTEPLATAVLWEVATPSCVNRYGIVMWSQDSPRS